MQNTRIKLSELIYEIRKESQNSKLDESLFIKLDKTLKQFASPYQVNEAQAFMMAIIYTLLGLGKWVKIRDLSKYFSCNTERLNDFAIEINDLEEKGILIKRKSRSASIQFSESAYKLEESIELSIRAGYPIPRVVQAKYNEVLDVLDKIYLSIQQERRNHMPNFPDKLFKKTIKILYSNKHLSFFRKITELGFSEADTCLFLYLCQGTTIGKYRSDLIVAMKCIYDYPVTNLPYIDQIFIGDNDLIKQGWVEFEESSILQDSKLKLSKKALEFLQSENIPLFSWKTRSDKTVPFSLNQDRPFELFIENSYFGKARIWNKFLSFLSLKECILLANNFDFSEEQISIIALKCEYQSKGFGIANINNIIEHCHNEAIDPENRFRLYFYEF